MAGQVMEAPAMHHQQQASMMLGQLHQANCKTENQFAASSTTQPATTTTAAAEMAYLHHLQQTAAAAEANNNGGGAQQRGEQCPRCASHDTKFCYYNNYNTSQPRHFCRACRRYWTLGGSLRNVPIGGSTRKRPRLAHPHMPPPASRRHVVFGANAATAAPPAPPTQGLLGSLFALGAAPLLEGRGGTAGFDLGLGLTMPSGAAFGEMQAGLGLRGGGLGGTSSSALLWPTGMLHNDSVDAWKVPGVVGAATSAPMWPDFSAAAALPQQAGGLLHGGAQLM
ncbi:hypothetical protein QOZ80_3AG0225520 [Eleusine coracana subsp. coracana]|uniref:DNA-binding with one finger protein n=1 Tax=Eleusine coracana TaxID=4511 RepID=A0A516SN20_ELECO|nr:hypothetical protein QOZ80_3AG0225520 [Eleusine coracana subsp. coracana]QDQ29861.1 DNA-binding with one finger protein [Eleusine coracana]